MTLSEVLGPIPRSSQGPHPDAGQPEAPRGPEQRLRVRAGRILDLDLGRQPDASGATGPAGRLPPLPPARRRWSMPIMSRSTIAASRSSIRRSAPITAGPPSSPEIHLPRNPREINVVCDNFIGPCFLYRNIVGRLIGDYDPGLGIEDYDYWMRVNHAFRIEHLGTDETLYRYRVHDRSLSGRAAELKIAERVDGADANGALAQPVLSQALDPPSSTPTTAQPPRGLPPVAASLARPRRGSCPGDGRARRAGEGPVPGGQHGGSMTWPPPTGPIPRSWPPGSTTSTRSTSGGSRRPECRRRRLLGPSRSRRAAGPAGDREPRRGFSRIVPRPGDPVRQQPPLLRAVPAGIGPTAGCRRSPCSPAGERHVLIQVDDFLQGGLENVVLGLARGLRRQGPAGLDAGPRPARPGGRAGAGGWHPRRDARRGASRSGVPGVAPRTAGRPGLRPLFDLRRTGRRGPRHPLRAGGAQHVCLARRARDRRLSRGRRRHDRVHLRLGRGGAVLRPPDGAVGRQDDRRPQRRGPLGGWTRHDRSEPERLREELGLSADDFVFLNVASIHATKAQGLLLRAMARVVADRPGRAPGHRGLGERSGVRTPAPPPDRRARAGAGTSSWPVRGATSGASTGWPTRSCSPRSGRAGAWR